MYNNTLQLRSALPRSNFNGMLFQATLINILLLATLGSVQGSNSSPTGLISSGASTAEITTTITQGFNNMSRELQQLLDPIVDEIRFLRHPGRSPCHPAHSCKQIFDDDPTSPSGYYWLQSSTEHLLRAYCDMTRTCGGIRGGWMKVVKIDMSNTSHSCPSGLRTLTQPRRLCAKNTDRSGCSHAILDVHGVEYSKVCGKIIGYQQKTPDAFYPYYRNRGLTIDQNYVDGISLTHGQHPRKHIWTFVAALHEYTQSYHFYVCPCTNAHNPQRNNIPIPPYVGNDYFCDTASSGHFEVRFYPYDPLWDGQGCGPLNSCCSFNNPPWFMKQLPSHTADNIEVRLCTDSNLNNEDMVFEKMEIYIQ